MTCCRKRGRQLLQKVATPHESFTYTWNLFFYYVWLTASHGKSILSTYFLGKSHTTFLGIAQWDVPKSCWELFSARFLAYHFGVHVQKFCFSNKKLHTQTRLLKYITERPPFRRSVGMLWDLVSTNRRKFILPPALPIPLPYMATSSFLNFPIKILKSAE